MTGHLGIKGKYGWFGETAACYPVCLQPKFKCEKLILQLLRILSVQILSPGTSLRFSQGFCVALDLGWGGEGHKKQQHQLLPLCNK